MIFKIYDCDIGFKINGIDYSFTHVNSVVIEDPEKNKLTRGSNAGNKTGLVFREGLKEPKTMTIEMIELTIDLKAVLDDAYENRLRMDVYAVNRLDGSMKMAKDSILSQPPRQLQISESVDSLQVALMFETFNLTETHKS